MKFSEASRADIAALHTLVESAYRGDNARKGWTHEADLLGGQRTDKDALLAIIENEQQVILLAHDRDGDEQRLAGCVHLSRLDGNTAYLGLLTVDPNLQAAGLGKTILQTAEQYVAEHWQAQLMEMNVIGQRGDLIAYYERRGYARTGEVQPFPMDDPRYGLPKADLEFVVLCKTL